MAGPSRVSVLALYRQLLRTSGLYPGVAPSVHAFFRQQVRQGFRNAQHVTDAAAATAAFKHGQERLAWLVKEARCQPYVSSAVARLHQHGTTGSVVPGGRPVVRPAELDFPMKLPPPPHKPMSIVRAAAVSPGIARGNEASRDDGLGDNGASTRVESKPAASTAATEASFASPSSIEASAASQSSCDAAQSSPQQASDAAQSSPQPAFDAAQSSPQPAPRQPASRSLSGVRLPPSCPEPLSAAATAASSAPLLVRKQQGPVPHGPAAVGAAATDQVMQAIIADTKPLAVMPVPPVARAREQRQREIEEESKAAASASSASSRDRSFTTFPVAASKFTYQGEIKRISNVNGIAANGLSAARLSSEPGVAGTVAAPLAGKRRGVGKLGSNAASAFASRRSRVFW